MGVADRAAVAQVITTILSGATCGEACWHAREDVCRCACHGANHGCLRGASGAPQPVRTAVIQGYRYRLAAVGDHDFWHERLDYNERGAPGRAYWSGYERGAPARARAASAGEVARWPELANYRNRQPWERHAHLLWLRVDCAEAVTP